MAVRRTCRGMVTAELAIGLLSVTVVLLALCWVVAVLVLQEQCIDTAAEVARQAARHDQAAVQKAKADAPRNAQVTVHRQAETLRAEVRLQARPFGLVLPPVALAADAEVVAEPGMAP